MKYHALLVIFEKRQNLKLLSVANYRWHFKGKNTSDSGIKVGVNGVY